MNTQQQQQKTYLDGYLNKIKPDAKVQVNTASVRICFSLLHYKPSHTLSGNIIEILSHELKMWHATFQFSILTACLRLGPPSSRCHSCVIQSSSVPIKWKKKRERRHCEIPPSSARQHEAFIVSWKYTWLLFLLTALRLLPLWPGNLACRGGGTYLWGGRFF